MNTIYYFLVKRKKIIEFMKNQHGMALVATLIFVSVLVTFGVALLAMTGDDSKLSTLQRESTRALYLAETGIEEAIWYMNSSEKNTDGLDYMPDDDPDDGIDKYFEKDFGSGETYHVEFEYNESTDIKTIKSTGTVAGNGKFDKGTRKIEVKLEKEIAKAPDLFYDYAVLTDGDMTINGGVSFHGNIHSNSNFTNNGTINLEYGTMTATGEIKDGTGLVESKPYQEFPRIAWDYYEGLSNSQKTIDDHIYNANYSGDVTFDSPKTLYGIHFVNGNVTITDELILHNATIFATGYIDIQTGNADVFLEKDEGSNPLALVSKESIDVSGNATITGDGIIQTEGQFDLGGNVNIRGAVYADDGIFGGGGGSMNLYYEIDLLSDPVPGTGIPVWKKTSWREVY